MSQRPVVSAAAERMYRLLPDKYRAYDEDTGWVTLALCAAMTTGFEPLNSLVDMTDPATSMSGTNELLNPRTIPRAWLGWLGALVSVDVTEWPVALQREVVAANIGGVRRGSRPAIRDAVARALSSQVPPPRVWANLSGVDPYLVTVVTNTAQTPDPVAALTAALTETPGDMVVELQVVDGVVLAEVEAAFATLAAVEAAFILLADVEEWTP